MSSSSTRVFGKMLAVMLLGALLIYPDYGRWGWLTDTLGAFCFWVGGIGGMLMVVMDD